jgi:hypothetical protein
VEKFPRPDDFLKGDTFTFPGGDFSGLSKPIPDFDDDLRDLLTDVFNSSQPSSIPENFSTGEPLIGPAYPGGDAGSVSEIPPLHNKTFQEVDQIIVNRSDLQIKDTTDPNYTTYIFKDGSRIDIRTNHQSNSKVPYGRITRSPSATGLRYRVGEGIIQTRDANNKLIPGAHDTNEFVKF